jgi:hypothetical protein
MAFDAPPSIQAAFEAVDTDEWQGIEAAPAAAKAPGYTQRHFPHPVADDTRLSIAGSFLIGYRVRQSPGWGTNRAELAREFGFGRISFYKAIDELTEAGYLKRTVTKRKNLKWFAREEIDLSEAKGRSGYQKLSRNIEVPRVPKGCWREAALLDYLNSFPHGFVVTPERIGHRYNMHVKTVCRIAAPLLAAGLIEEGEIKGVAGYIRGKRRAASVPLPEKPDTVSPEVANTKVGQNQHAGVGQNQHAGAGQNQHTPYREGQVVSAATCVSAVKTEQGLLAEHTCEASLPLNTALSSPAPAVRLTKGSASWVAKCEDAIRRRVGATFPETAEGAASLEGKHKPQAKAQPKAAKPISRKPEPQGKKAPRKAASTKPRKPEPREWIAVLDADGNDVIKRLQRNDRNGVLHPMLFRYGAVQELAELLDNVERVAASIYGARLGPHARDAAVLAIIGKLCGWATFAEMDEQGVRTWDYFDEAIQHEVQLAIEEARYAA